MECNAVFTTNRPDQKNCSTECSRKESTRRRNKLRKAAIRDGEKFDTLAVFDRDMWHCRICGIETPRELRGTFKPNAPELDHIVPITRGGKHTFANSQLACRACNTKKGNSMPDAKAISCEAVQWAASLKSANGAVNG